MKKENQPGTLTIENSNAFRPNPFSSTAPELPLPLFASTLVARRSVWFGSASLALLSTVVTGMTALAQTKSQNAASPREIQLMAQAAAAQPMSYAELERLYLEGKITAKRYQELLSQIQGNPAPAAPTIQPPPQAPPPSAPLVIPAAPQTPAPIPIRPPVLPAAPGPVTTSTEAERLYLSGRISAEQYQQMLSDLQSGRPTAPIVTQPAPPPQPNPTPGTVVPPGDLALPVAPLTPKTTKHEVSLSGDFLYGQGHVTLPINFSLAAAELTVQRQVAKAPRDSEYLGATVSYSYGQAWYLDVSFAHGTSSGNADIPVGGGVELPSQFTIDDNWYQAYVRYTFPALRGTRLSAYLRVGFSYVTADLSDEAVIPAVGLYQQTDKTEDILGNLGFGVAYSLYRTTRVKTSVQFEGEGFYGRRSQDSFEVVPEALGFPYKHAKIDNDLYGGIARLTARFEYSLGRSGLFKLFADGGVQGKFTLIQYPEGVGSFDELLWGPYAKVGFRYSF